MNAAGCSVVLLATMLALEAGAADIHKCVDGGSVSYQSMPCAGAQRPVRLALAGDAPQAVRAPVAETRGKRGPWWRTAIEVGMSDDEVLNLAGWGRPARIERTRLPRGWQEVWLYGDRYGGERELRFVNTRLEDIAQTPALQASTR